MIASYNSVLVISFLVVSFAEKHSLQALNYLSFEC